MSRRAGGAGRSGQAGFTLLEILVALVVLGFIMAGLAQATRFGAAAWSLQARQTAEAGSLERTGRVLRDLIGLARPPLGLDQKPFAGEAHRLVFLTLLPEQPQTSPIRRAEVAIGVDETHRLVLRWRPQPNADPLLPPAPPQEIVLADGIEAIDLSYRQPLTPKGAPGQWVRSWTENGLPALVQIHFVRVHGRHPWPDLVAAPMVDSNGTF